MISYYSSLVLTIWTSHAAYKSRLELILNGAQMWFIDINLPLLSPIRTELLTSVLSRLGLDVTLNGLNFLTVVRIISRMFLENILIYLL